MADVQLENGFTRIANELLEALVRSRLSGRELRIVLAVVRKTFGFQKKSDRISFGQISTITGIARQHVASLTCCLEKRGIVYIGRAIAGPNRIGLQKDYGKWLPSPKDRTSKVSKSSANEGASPLSPSPKDGTSPEDGTTLVLNTGLELVPKTGLTKEKKILLQKKALPEAKSASDDIAADIFTCWNSQQIMQHRSLASVRGLSGALSAALKRRPSEEIVAAIQNYAAVIKSPAHFFKYRWTLKDFLTRGLDRFAPEADPLTNFKKRPAGTPEQPERKDAESALWES